MKISKKIERDYAWYLKWKDTFVFDGTAEYVDRKGKSIFVYDEMGLSAKECFAIYDSKGKISPCREIELYKQIHKCKGSINFNIKIWAEDRGKGWLGKNEFMETIAIEYELLDWMINAVEQQRMKHWTIKKEE